MPETADRTESLFAAAVALPPEEREAYLERECSGDPALRDRLLALLRAHDRAGHVIDRPVNGDPDQTAGYAPTSEQPGTIIAGRYKLLEEIGQGGMGTVWAAEQTMPVRRKVALKLIKAGMDSRSVLARFEAERQALALMDHPNIAKVLDGGLTESGRPYFVMEYVKGVPITEYCDATRLSVEERLNLFVQVCSALQHAHQKGIIHRDLKPSNILVAPYDDKPVPKVIDFGLAKAMHQSLTEKTLYTAHEMVLGTPLYMSPEQAQLNNLDVDTRADIYSLGVLLYELLTGTTPLERKRFKEAAWDEIRRMIREEEPPRPSTRLSSTDTLPSLATFRHTEPAKLKKLVRGELDWIVMKALEKDRTRRYETANGLARDIQRYLDDEVVEARPPSTGYRIGKFVRRHRAQVIAAGLVLLALLAGIAGTTWGLIREARAKTPTCGIARPRAEGERRPVDRQRQGPGPLRSGRRRRQDVPHGRERRLSAQGREVQGSAQPAPEVGIGFLRQARRTPGQGDRLRLAAGAGGIELRAGRADSQGRPPGGRAGGAPGGAGGAGGAGGRAGGRRRREGRRRPEPDRRRLSARLDREAGRGAGDLPPFGVAAGGPGRIPTRPRAAALAALSHADGRAAGIRGQARRGAGGLPVGAGRPRSAGRSSGGLERRPSRAGGNDQLRSATCCGTRQAGRGGARVPHGDGDLSKAGRRKPRRLRVRRLGDQPPLSRPGAVVCRQAGERRRPSFALRSAIHQKLADDNPAVTNFRNTAFCRICSATCFATRASRRRLSAARRWRSCRSWWTKIPASRVPAVGWQCATELGLLLLQTGKPAEAEAECRKAEALCGSWPRIIPPSPASADTRLVPSSSSATSTSARPGGRGQRGLRTGDRPEGTRLRRIRRTWYSTTTLACSIWRRGRTLLISATPLGAAADVRRAIRLFDELLPQHAMS